LCRECDNEVIGRLESYASKIIYEGKNDKNEPLPVTNYLTKEGNRVLVIQGINY
jgi:hypothetical protein